MTSQSSLPGVHFSGVEEDGLGTIEPDIFAEEILEIQRHLRTVSRGRSSKFGPSASDVSDHVKPRTPASTARDPPLPVVTQQP